MVNENLYQGINLGKERKERLKKFALQSGRSMVGVIRCALDDFIPVEEEVENLEGEE